MFLGFLPGELRNIEADPSLFLNAPVSRLRKMLELWLQCDSDSRGSITLESLKVAMSKVGLGASAHQLTVKVGHAEKYSTA